MVNICHLIRIMVILTIFNHINHGQWVTICNDLHRSSWANQRICRRSCNQFNLSYFEDQEVRKCWSFGCAQTLRLFSRKSRVKKICKPRAFSRWAGCRAHSELESQIVLSAALGVKLNQLTFPQNAHVDERWLKEPCFSLGLTSELWNEFVG